MQNLVGSNGDVIYGKRRSDKCKWCEVIWTEREKKETLELLNKVYSFKQMYVYV